MIEDSGYYYIYRHIRLDTNEVFYVGVGTKRLNCSSYNLEYSRARTKNKRNNHWLNITKNSKYYIEVILESNDHSFILEKEIEFIKLYGRRDIGTGTLCNWTNGGEGLNGYKWTQEQKLKITGNTNASGKRSKEYSERMSVLRKGRKAWNKGIKNSLIAMLKSKLTLQFDLNNTLIFTFPSVTEAAKVTDICMNSINKCVNNKRKTAGGYIWKYK